MTAPDGLARVDRTVHEDGRTANWIAETSVHQLPAVWRAYVDGNTPPYLVSALFGALADETPLVREPHRVPRLASTQGRTSSGQVSAETLAFALERRTTSLAQRRTPPPLAAAPSSPNSPKPRRPR